MSVDAMAVVVGLDVGGTKTNATVLTDDGRFLVDHMVEVASGVLEGPSAAIAAIDEAMSRVLEDRVGPRIGARHRARHARAGQRQWRDLGPWGDELRRGRVVGVRLPRRRRATPEPSRDLSQRRQRGRAVRPRAALWRRRTQAFIRVGNRRHRLGRRCGRSRSRDPWRCGHGRRARPRADPDGRPAGAGPTGAALQLRARRRPREHRVAQRHRQEPAAVLADSIPGPSVGRHRSTSPPNRSETMESEATSSPGGSSTSRQRRSGGCSPSLPTSSIRTRTSSAVA